MKASMIFLSSGIGLFLFTILSREIALQVRHSAESGAPLWLLVPSFLLVSIGADAICGTNPRSRNGPAQCKLIRRSLSLIVLPRRRQTWS